MAMTERSFRSSGGLRELLIRLHRDPQRWRHDPEAAALVAYCAERYRALARAGTKVNSRARISR